MDLCRRKRPLRRVGETPKTGTAIDDQAGLVAEPPKMPEATVRRIETVLGLTRYPVGRQSHQFLDVLLDQVRNHCLDAISPPEYRK